MCVGGSGSQHVFAGQSRELADCKSVAKATEVRILDPPRAGKSAPDDLGQPRQGSILLGPAESSVVRASAAVHEVGVVAEA